ncbi:leucine-rich repeat domain-containing protein [Tenacibaculum finnmarkense]|uniref:hypothetical protein n=3 Tax=Tenacibaculum finnmarkense TaxID=2781243 RepID=UPI001EFA4CEA|nr:hypothetical protein [Tenacibaculum finnmarkense]MCG8203671.1 hypothetical protein [Tenacibaculum finnmarkense genomovar finnmarkense]MCG8748077.1 leucine-rich repeat domain-containing protein [Tenacibaculum finnmarkense]MCG8760888.1 leucine-rich repeat domain-containing protein [Tenacibaculum finnmarkense]MCG8881524.1 leucine-rich repeat domain-containing protein [Tenacibaculum finnmarkense]MCG8902724.1 leucine-rich repeat domain-containing protein [Tenacibaculum finnmarkense]
MGMSSSRRYGSQEITLVTTSKASDWKVEACWSESRVTWNALGKVYHGNEPTIDFSGNTGSEAIVIRSSQGFTGFNGMYDGCQIKSIDLQKTTSLNTFAIRKNQVKVLDVSNNTNLQSLLLSDNKIEVLDVSNNTKLESLDFSRNQVKVLDVSKNTSLTGLWCDANPLTIIYVNQTQLDMINGVIPKLPNWYWQKDYDQTYVLKQ